MSGLVSVIVPTYNRAYCIGATIESIQRQTYADWEAIVVDDGSTDSTGELMERLSAQDARVRYIRRSNGGVAAARNTALSHARGDFVAFLDSDDLWESWKLEAQVQCLVANPAAGMIWTDMHAIDDQGRLLADRYLKRMYGAYKLVEGMRLFRSAVLVKEGLPLIARDSLIGQSGFPENALLYLGNIYRSMLLGNLVHTSTVMLTRERLEQVRCFDENLRLAGEDYDFHLRTCRCGEVAFLDVPSIKYRVGAADQLTHSGYHLQIARNTLTTVSKALSSQMPGEPIGRRLEHRILAKAHAWVGHELFYAGQYREARAELRRSLLNRPWQPEVMLRWAAALLPASVIEMIRLMRSEWLSFF